jgi:hypothetical protein
MSFLAFICGVMVVGFAGVVLMLLLVAAGKNDTRF